MIKIMNISILSYLVFTVSVILVDFYYFLLDRYGRFHIGRFKNEEEWEKKVIRKAVKWLKKEPTVKFTDNNRYILVDMLTGKFRNNNVQSWQKGALILSIQKYGDRYRKELQNCINSVINENGEFVKNPTNIDCGFLAYAILKCCNPNKIKPAMDYVANLIINNIGEDGMIIYTNDKESTERYVDSIGLAVPFLMAYAETYDIPEIKKIAMRQLKVFTRYGIDCKSGLPSHAYNSQNTLLLGVNGWGRGCAWYSLGLIDSYLELSDSENREWIKKQIKVMADVYKNYQRDDGGFGFILQMKNGYDSSATAVMAYFYKNCYDIFNEYEYYDVYKNCLKKLQKVTKINGALDWCQGDTKGIGVFSQRFSIMPFAQGMLVRSFGEGSNNG